MLGNYETPTTASVSASSVPVATLIYSASGRNPFGYVLAAGEAFARGVFPELTLAVDNNYTNVDTPSGTYSAASDIKVPNLFSSGGRFPLASDLVLVNTSNINNQGAGGLFGGNTSITLTANQIPPHRHDATVQGTGYTSTDGGNGNRANVGQTGSAIYNSAGTLLTASAGTPSAVNVQNPFGSVYALIRSTNLVPSYYQTGCVNIDSTNNMFWVRFRNSGSLVTNGTQVCTLQTGAFTTTQFISNIINSVAASLLLTSIAQTTVLMNFTVNSQGRYVYKMFCGTGSITVEFNFTQTPGVSIPFAVLDKTADTLGYYTRTSITYAIGFFTNQRDYISPPKAMKIYFGSVEEGSMSSANLPNITNSF
jgi:hypothetical protein